MQASKNASYLENEHGDHPFFFLPVWQKYIINYLRGKFKKNLYVGT